MKVSFGKRHDPRVARVLEALAVYGGINRRYEAFGKEPPYDTRELEIMARLRPGPVPKEKADG